MVRGIIVVLAVAFTSSIAVSLLIANLTPYFASSTTVSLLAAILLVFLMFTPTIGVLAACKITGESPLRYGLSELSLKEVKKPFFIKILILIAKVYGSAFTKKQYTLIAIIYVYILSVLNTLVYYIVHGYSPPIFEAIRTLFPIVPEKFIPIVASGLLVNALVNGIVGLLPALGEEACWRGFLLDKFAERLGFTKAALLVGIIWGLWHSPLILIVGYEYGVKYPDPKALVGVLVFTVLCVTLGYFFAWLRSKSGTATVPALAHSVYNGAAGLLIVTYWNEDLLYAGGVGVPAIVSLTIFLLLLSFLKVFRKEL
ncbi:MAG: hypothetical protein DRJ52_10205 [Thermoprotei archaeon]|nr:MAG: hypothetical protein DRJ52_10205 [Thermoprotei archaeon]RLF00228.1 MAG: hypothetical protein DRJ63_02945 [Thermoprotei archaeon]HDI75341.1 CPBP family intramembrane metalloprotease [Thermoprotei archaeon]